MSESMAKALVEDAPEKTPEVRTWLNALSEELERAWKVKDDLGDRISCVLRKALPANSEEEEKSKSEDSISPLSDEIREKVKMLAKITDNYEYMLNRLEL